MEVVSNQIGQERFSHPNGQETLMVPEEEMLSTQTTALDGADAVAEKWQSRTEFAAVDAHSVATAGKESLDSDAIVVESSLEDSRTDLCQQSDEADQRAPLDQGQPVEQEVVNEDIPAVSGPVGGAEEPDDPVVNLGQEVPQQQPEQQPAHETDQDQQQPEPIASTDASQEQYESAATERQPETEAPETTQQQLSNDAVDVMSQEAEAIEAAAESVAEEFQEETVAPETAANATAQTDITLQDKETPVEMTEPAAALEQEVEAVGERVQVTPGESVPESQHIVTDEGSPVTEIQQPVDAVEELSAVRDAAEHGSESILEAPVIEVESVEEKPVAEAPPEAIEEDIASDAQQVEDVTCAEAVTEAGVKAVEPTEILDDGLTVEKIQEPDQLVQTPEEQPTVAVVVTAQAQEEGPVDVSPEASDDAPVSSAEAVEATPVQEEASSAVEAPPAEISEVSDHVQETVAEPEEAASAPEEEEIPAVVDVSPEVSDEATASSDIVGEPTVEDVATVVQEVSVAVGADVTETSETVDDQQEPTVEAVATQEEQLTAPAVDETAAPEEAPVAPVPAADGTSAVEEAVPCSSHPDGEPESVSEETANLLEQVCAVEEQQQVAPVVVEAPVEGEVSTVVQDTTDIPEILDDGQGPEQADDALEEPPAIVEEQVSAVALSLVTEENPLQQSPCVEDDAAQASTPVEAAQTVADEPERMTVSSDTVDAVGADAPVEEEVSVVGVSELVSAEPKVETVAIEETCQVVTSEEEQPESSIADDVAAEEGALDVTADASETLDNGEEESIVEEMIVADQAIVQEGVPAVAEPVQEAAPVAEPVVTSSDSIIAAIDLSPTIPTDGDDEDAAFDVLSDELDAEVDQPAAEEPVTQDIAAIEMELPAVEPNGETVAPLDDEPPKYAEETVIKPDAIAVIAVKDDGAAADPKKAGESAAPGSTLKRQSSIGRFVGRMRKSMRSRQGRPSVTTRSTEQLKENKPVRRKSFAVRIAGFFNRLFE